MVEKLCAWEHWGRWGRGWGEEGGEQLGWKDGENYVRCGSEHHDK